MCHRSEALKRSLESHTAYKQSDSEDADAHDLIIRAWGVGVCSNRLIPSVLHEWREPRHREFESRTVWTLFNSFTESMKDGNLAELPKRPKHCMDSWTSMWG